MYFIGAMMSASVSPYLALSFLDKREHRRRTRRCEARAVTREGERGGGEREIEMEREQRKCESIWVRGDVKAKTLKGGYTRGERAGNRYVHAVAFSFGVVTPSEHTASTRRSVAIQCRKPLAINREVADIQQD